MFVSKQMRIILAVLVVSGQALAASPASMWRFLQHHLAPLRSNTFRQASARPCDIGIASCFAPVKQTQNNQLSYAEKSTEPADEDRLVFLELRTAHRGPFVHHWIETETSNGRVTVGYGPATLPFIDAGQISLQDSWGNVERISGMHPLPPLGLPPVNYRYARAPGDGHVIGKPVVLTLAQSNALVAQIRQRKFVVPYIPMFHDCRTFVCTTQAKARNRSTLPCYFLFKGWW